LVENYRDCLETIQDVAITFERSKTAYYLEQTRAQNSSISEYCVVEQKYQFTHWDNWSREEQIENSIATDQASAVNGNCSIPKYCFLLLKKE
jgi:hypothetical protein